MNVTNILAKFSRFKENLSNLIGTIIMNILEINSKQFFSKYLSILCISIPITKVQLESGDLLVFYFYDSCLHCTTGHYE